MNAARRVLATTALLLIITATLAARAHADSIVERDTYLIGEHVPLNIPDTSAPVRIIIDAPDGRFRLLDSAPAPFIPKAAGNHTISVLTLDGELIARDSFIAIAPPPSSDTPQQTGMFAILLPDEMRVGENALIRIVPTPRGPVDITISGPGGRFKYSGPWADAPFQPRAQGHHEITVAQDGAVIAQQGFEVAPALADMPPRKTNDSNGSTDNKTSPATTPPQHDRVMEHERGRTGDAVNGTIDIDIGNPRGTKEKRAARLLRKRSSPDGDRYDVELEPDLKAARRIIIHDLRIEGNLGVGVAPVPTETVRSAVLRRSGPVVKSFAIDLGGLNFSDAVVTNIAQGTELYKCAAWDYDAQACNGVWTKAANIVPGQEYAITLAPGDPGYAETGVATVNSVKPVYLPHETAQLYIVVLDTSGFLVNNANVTLTIIAPDGANTTLTSAAQQVTRQGDGVYYATYGATSIEGNYTLIVDAAGPDVRSILGSSFTVMADYPFDILRDTPITTDPFQGPFASSINVHPRIAVDEYDLTEVLPAEFGVVNAGGANLSADSASTYLTWEGLTGDATVTYVAQPPAVSPALFALGKAFITYVQDSVVRVFTELRVWLLAIDPEVTNDQGLFVYGDQTDNGIIKQRNWTGSTLTAEENSPVDFGDQLTWFKFRCLDDRPQCLLATNDGGNDLNFAVFNTDNWSWSNITQLDNNIGLDDEMQFDVECMDNNGSCLIAYEDGTASNTNFALRIWNGSTITGVSSKTVTGAESDDFRWIKLYPQKGTDRIGIALQNEGGGTAGTPAIYAGMWNGTDFADWQTLTTNGPSDNSERTNYRHFDCAWEGGNARFLCAYSDNGVAGVLAYRWNTSSTWSNLGNIYAATGSEVWEFALCGQEPSQEFNHSFIGMLFCDDASDLDGAIWNGSSLSKNGTALTPAANNNAECGANKGASQWGQNFQCAWEDSGDQVLFVWVNANGDNFLTSGTYTRSTDSYSNSAWSSGTQIVATGAGDLREAGLSVNDRSDKVMLTYSDASLDGGCSLWTGTTWDGTGCNNQQVFETNGARAARRWLTFDWFRTPPPQPDITINAPNSTQAFVNYSGVLNPSTTSAAYENTTNTLLPPTSAPQAGSEFPSAGYVNISTSDDTYRRTVASGAGGLHASQMFNFSVTTSAISINQIVLDHEGRATQAVAQTSSAFNIYAYNWSNNSYGLLDNVFASAVDVLTERTITVGFTDYIRNRQMHILVEGQFATAGGGNARAEVMTDYIGLTITSRPVLRGNFTVNATATDDDGISACVWAIVNTTSGSQFGNISSLPANGSYYVNINDSALYPDGDLNLTVRCNDTLNNKRNTSERVRIDNTKPLIFIYTLLNNSNTSASSAIFSWNTTDIFGENMLCNITINTTVSATNFVSPHGENNTKNITGIADGIHNWTIICYDDAGNSNISDPRYFTVDTVPPSLTLSSPSAGGYVNSTTVNFTYTASDANGLQNCTLRLDNTDNSTTAFPISGVLTNFTIAGVSEGLHWWNITCFDTFAKTNLSATRNVTVDATLPAVYLNTTNGITFNNTPAVLNFTAFDNIDTNLTCNITVNGTNVFQNINATSGFLVSKSVALTDGDKSWNVTCVDDAGNVNISQTRFFRVLGGPAVTLQRPGNGSVNNGINVNFTYYTQDGDGIANCSLIIDDVVNQANISAVTNGANNSFIANLTEGVHNWTINCSDTFGTVGTAAPYLVSADKSAPNIVLNGPNAGQTLTVTPTVLNFTMTDIFSPNATCNITVDGSVNAANLNFSALNATLTVRTQTIINGLHYWNVTCVDLGNNSNISLTRNFTVNATFPLTVNVTANKKQYQEGELAYINITVRNETSTPVAANGTFDLIYTNTSSTNVSWWNVSWGYRKPIVINETSNVARNSKPVAVNVSGLFGHISSCTNEIRVVRDSDLSLVAFNILSGDDVTYCYLQFNATVAANQNNQLNYHVYYNNSAGTNPNFPNITGRMNIFTDAFPSISASWTADSGWDQSTNDPLGGSHAHVDGVVVNANLTIANAFNLSQYDNANLSFEWGIDGTWDNNEFIKLDFSNNSGATWTSNQTILWGGLGAFDQVEYFLLNSSYRVDGFKFHFKATVDGGAEDGGVDDVNLTVWNDLQNVTAGVKEEQVWINRTVTNTNASGNSSVNITTVNRQQGNYSVVDRFTHPLGLNSAGTGADWFRIVRDVFGPVVNLTIPANGSTNHSGLLNFTYLASDVANGVANCTIVIDNVVNGTNTTPINTTANNSYLATVGEGTHTWQVNCTDTLGNNGSSNISTFFLDDTAPNITRLAPNGTTYSSTNATLSFNASDNLDNLLSCVINLSGPSPSNISINATNSTNTSTTATNLSDGTYFWNVTCRDNINNSATSATVTFFVDRAPVVNLFSPANGYGVNATGITLFYNVTENALQNCTLILNGTANQSNTSAIPFTNNDGNDNFTLAGMQYGRYNWTVICYDQSNSSGNTSTRMFQLDNDAPTVTLNTPANGSTLFSTSVTFNWTVVDTDPNPVCNITLDNVINVSNFASNESVPTMKIIAGVKAGNHSWNVTCWDAVNYTGFSAYRNFSIDGSVNVSLSSPANNSIDGDGSVNFTYTPSSISGFTLGFCDLYIDSVDNATHIGLSSGTADTFTINNIIDGVHTWYVNCTDSVGTLGISETRRFIMDLQDPVVLAHSPNGTAFNSSSVFFNWTPTDNLDLNMTCDVRVNNSFKTPGNISAPNATTVNATYSGFTDGYFIWNVTCYDDGNRNGTSATLNFTVQEAPKVVLNGPASGNRTRNQAIIFTYTPSDNSGTLANCTWILDNAPNTTNTSVTNGSQNTFNISGIPEGFHRWNVTCTDFSNNTAQNISGRNFTIDITPPHINLTKPANGSAVNGNNVSFNWTPIDTSSSTMVCNITVTNLTGNLSQSGISGSNGTNFNATISNLGEGGHNWSVTCQDDVGNINTSELYSFVINQPDLYLNDTLVSVNDTNPAIGSAILLFANVSNIGGITATNFIIAFWDGLPGVGTSIGNATGNLSSNTSVVLNVSWVVTTGYHPIWVVADPANVIGELNETNNNATMNISAIFVNITSPANATLTGDSTPQVSFNATDFTSGNIDYRIFIDGSANAQNATVAAGSNTSLNISTLADGTHRVVVMATDALSRTRNSTALTVIIDTTPPNATFVTRNGTFFPTATFNATIRVNDTVDLDINYTIYVNGTLNKTGNVTNATNTNATLSSFSEGAYLLLIEGRDDAGNAANGTNITIYVDSTAPAVTPIAPIDGANFPNRSVNISYSVTDNLDPLLACILNLDGANVSLANVTNGATQGYAATGLAEGIHQWNVTCWDGDNNANQINNIGTAATRSFTVSIPPSLTLIAPANATTTGNATTTFTFNASDETGLANCSIIINGVLNQTKTTAQLTLNGTSNFTVSGLNNTVLWAIACTDNSTAPSTNTTENRTLYVDTVAPFPTINTASERWFNTSSPSINITIIDNFDTILNWTFFIDNVTNANGSAANGTFALGNLSGVSDGNHSIILQAFDDAGNYRNSTAITVYVDTQAPNVTLVSPSNDTNLSATSVTLNFTAIDNLANSMMCNLTLDNAVVQQYNLTNSSYGAYFASNLATGYHYWNASCLDNASNRGISATFRFFVQLPDLVITDGNITASNTTPVENQTIQINATVFNTGQLNASNVTVQFWRGTPGAGGSVQLGANQTIPLLGIGQNATLTINYTTIVGINQIYVAVDPPTASNGSILEQNETNNVAHLDILVGIYQVFAGGTANELRISDNVFVSAFTWNESDVTGSNVLVADTDSSLTFSRLLAIGRNATNGTNVGTNDFQELDNKLGINVSNESINLTWTIGGVPVELENITLFARFIHDVPMVNSTNTSSFRTGILWDSADGGNAYNGSQDVAFITVMNQSKAGRYGTYDYEIKVPAPLRDYIAGGGTVTFYTEIA